MTTLITAEKETTFALHQRNVKTKLYTVRRTVHTHPSRKPSFTKTLFKPEESENTGFAF